MNKKHNITEVKERKRENAFDGNIRYWKYYHRSSAAKLRLFLLYIVKVEGMEICQRVVLCCVLTGVPEVSSDSLSEKQAYLFL